MWESTGELLPARKAHGGTRHYAVADLLGYRSGPADPLTICYARVSRPIIVDELSDGELRGYSETLGLYLCWRQGRLDWYDPSTEDYIPSLESERQLLHQAEERVRQLEVELCQRG